MNWPGEVAAHTHLCTKGEASSARHDERAWMVMQWTHGLRHDRMGQTRVSVGHGRSGMDGHCAIRSCEQPTPAWIGCCHRCAALSHQAAFQCGRCRTADLASHAWVTGGCMTKTPTVHAVRVRGFEPQLPHLGMCDPTKLQCLWLVTGHSEE